MPRKKILNTPPEIGLRVDQMLTAVTCDTRLELSLEAIALSKEALIEALNLTTEIKDGLVPEITGLDDKIQDALAAIDEVINENFSIKSRQRMMNRIVRQIEKHKGK